MIQEAGCSLHLLHERLTSVSGPAFLSLEDVHPTKVSLLTFQAIIFLCVACNRFHLEAYRLHKVNSFRNFQ